jgi:hypothetical protein
MADSQLLLHCGARLVEEDELRQVKAPPPEGRWYPLPHTRVLDVAKQTLGDAGYQVRAQKLALSRGDARFFGTLDLATNLASGVSLAVAIRSSVDKSFPLGFCAGNRVFCCDNLAFRSELLVKRKHTVNGEARFTTAIAEAVTQLGDFQEMESQRIRTMMHAELSSERADSLILRAFEKGIVTTLDLPRVLHEWRNPSYGEFEDRTEWSLFNAFTTVLARRAIKQPQAHALQTMRLNALLGASEQPLAQAT